MSSKRLPLIAPKTVALIGASDTPGKIAARPQTFLRQHGFRGRIYPVNPMRETVLGEKAYASLADVPEEIDHAYILVDTEAAVAAVAQCAEARIPVVSVLADGFAEAGPQGLERQKTLVEYARQSGMLLLGPNSMGVVDTRSGFVCTTNAAFRIESLEKGRVGVISQSGSLIGSLLSRGQDRGVAFSTLVSVGNEAAAGIGEIGSILVEDDGTDSIILFMETIRNPSKIAVFARRAKELGKPIVAYLVGLTEEGQALSVSHTGAMTGSVEVKQAFLDSLGIARVDHFDSLLEAPLALRQKTRLTGRPSTVTVVSTTGGGGAMVIDRLSASGVEIAPCSIRSREALTVSGIPLGHGKLVDVTLAGARYDTMRTVIETLIADPATGALVVAIGSSASLDPELAVQPIVDAVMQASIDTAPVFGFPVPFAPCSIKLLEQGGIPCFRSVESCAETIAHLFHTSVVPTFEVEPDQFVRDAIQDLPSGNLHEVEAGEVFRRLGIAAPAQSVIFPGECIASKLNGLRFPLVAKIVSKHLPHKSDAGAVTLGLESLRELEQAIEDMRVAVARSVPEARIEAILIQEMLHGVGEALIGLTRDPLVGPVVTVASGGVLTEIYKDFAIHPAPVSFETAKEMVAKVKAFALLRGYRGHAEGDLDALARAVVAVSRLGSIEEVIEAEINPVLVLPSNEGVVMLDALVRLK